MLLINHIAKIIFLLILFQSINYAQSQDTLAFRNTQNDTLEYELQKSPWGAVARSAVLPGLGQFYNHSYWKIPVVWGFTGYYLYYWLKYDKSYKDWQNKYTESIIMNSPNQNYKYYRDFYRNNRDRFVIYLGLTYLLNLVDAYVDAHFYGFSIDEDVLTNSTNLNLYIKF